MAKKYTSPTPKAALSVKEQSGHSATEAPRFATPEMMRKALSHVMKVHGEALDKLSK